MGRPNLALGTGHGDGGVEGAVELVDLGREAGDVSFGEIALTGRRASESTPVQAVG